MAGRRDTLGLRSPVHYLRRVLAELGPDQSLEILRESGLVESDLDSPDQRVSVDVEFRAVRALNAQVGSDWVLRAMPAWDDTNHGALEVAFRTAKDFGSAVAILAAYGSARAPHFSFRKAQWKGAIGLTIEPLIGLETDLLRPVSEGAAISIRNMVREFLRRPIPEIEFAFPWAPPGHARALESELGCSVKYGARAFEFRAPEAWSRLKSPYADHDLHAAACDRLARALPIAQDNSARGRLLRALDGPSGFSLGAEGLARALGMSRRTLARRLADEGASFRSVREEALKAAAERLIADARSREEIAERLGFSDPTSFSRACRRWFGASMRGVKARQQS